MDPSTTTPKPLAGKLRYSDAEHGWALDVGSFLAAWATSITALASCEIDTDRLRFIRYARLYAFNVVRRLASVGLDLDLKTLEPKDFQQMRKIVDDVSAKIWTTWSTAHCGFLLLGMATTYISLALKPGMPTDYQSTANRCAKASINELQQLGQSSSDQDAETILAELIRLDGNIEKVRCALLQCSKAEPCIPSKELHDHKIESVVIEKELPHLLQQAAI